MTEHIKIPHFPEPYWRDSVDFSNFPKLDKSIEADVGIVGGGITGITAAYLLAKQNVKVVLIDAGVILNGTTGHTTAKITAQHGLIYNELIEHFGLEKASMYYKASSEAKEFIKNTIDKHDISCDFTEEDAYLYTNSDFYLSKLEMEKKAYDRLKIPSELVKNMPLEVPMKSALIMKNQAQYHPLKYLKKLVKDSIKNGTEIYEHTTAIDVEYNKHPSIITRDGHRVSCRYVIQASHYPFYDGQGFYPTRMYADRSYVVAIKSDKKFPGGMYINAESPTRSIRSTQMDGKDLWLVGGENHKTGQSKSTINHYKALEQFAEKEFGISEYIYRWSAQDLITLDKVPYIGPITKEQRSVFVATGFRKWGMTNGTLAAQMISDLILAGESNYQDLYSPSRFQADPAVREFTSINADVAKHLIKGKLEYTSDLVSELSQDEATVTRIKGKRTGVYKDQDDKLHMVDTTCTHLGCEVEWNSGDRTWDCPCHGSRFSYTGDVVEGPAKRPLNKVKND
ncbi:FAD-dependent oxidoreductase [Virgibacillus necropolis]|uniref:FAD-dependent oxidoreductase n=1 Tax=Virgibacillus necropolis TaxID=163877 RepID=A0A221MD61_9BACI|nr:FAD-dependent oxidoreductase [Virgibacillus necropolis]ASN05571.1 FAD-dependent oxidoreductase [Virgibacillus necropolis]